jgi:hypothetical protein
LINFYQDWISDIFINAFGKNLAISNE